MASPAQIAQRRANGYRTFAKHGSEHMRQMGRKGGRPTFEATVAKAWAHEQTLQAGLRTRKRGVAEHPQASLADRLLGRLVGKLPPQEIPTGGNP